MDSGDMGITIIVCVVAICITAYKIIKLYHPPKWEED